ncbi:MarR family transcriptional regulator [Geobacter sulfurreducens]|jgi:DNA-binding MarR family transcriptional regulator|uniref:MarR family winged helix-turn-helix transcriptional regulator n=1 Tax=Geobacter TaxID=28231 RepID=UPI0001D8F3FB|nr:MarR family transcriptional regulator [Geobacter sulfurreducens]BET57858.1 MarR family transcriptional regulator [Geobacter sp. 60473]ADI84322.1 winged helix-turn-helix transcriptional regulator, MarR family [Geobacter sulfurreducens KN400]QVW36660.1 MarR family transcriptional regulator [Geobacter sulfurreducens]UTG94127.1 MarR family transcriptional regulator [Geobacter sulfurreducens]BEH10533.1 MarR family transcriptional regulator [Geobacter sulfurreducens subsp. ethanolicus]
MYDIENSIGFLLAKAYQRGFALFKEQLDPYGLTPPQFSLLAFLWKEDGQSQTALSQKTLIDRTTIGGLVDRLEKLGLVKRQPHPEDRRAYRVCLTGRGKELEHELCATAAEVLTLFLAPLSDDEQDNLRHLLKQIRIAPENRHETSSTP